MNSKDFRAKTVKELIDTEKTYIGQLTTILKFFSEPCASEGLLNTSNHSKVFGELPVLLQLNQELLSELTASLGSPLLSCKSGQETSQHHVADNEQISPSSRNDGDQRDQEKEEILATSTCQTHPDAAPSDLLLYLKVDVGKAFRKIAPFFKTYSFYASKYEQALNIIEEQERSCSKLRAFLRNTETRPEVQCRLVSLLIAPIQRLPRYKLLLAEILRHTPPGHPFRQPLENSLALVAAAAARVDQCVGEGHQLLQLTVLQRALYRSKPRIIAPGRALIKSGLLYKANRSDSGSVARLFFLFTDILMYTKLPSKPPPVSKLSAEEPYGVTSVLSYKPDSLECCCVLPLRHCSVIPILADDDCTPVFRVVCLNEDLTLYSKNGKGAGQAWIRALKEAISAAAANRRTLKKDSSAKRPLRRAQLRRGDALAETDTSLQQLKASSPLTRLTSPLRSTPSSPSTEDPSPLCSSPSSVSSCRSGTSFQTVSQSPRSLVTWFTQNKCSVSSPDVSCNPSINDVESIPPGRSLSNADTEKNKSEQQFSTGSSHSLDSIGSKLSVALRKKGSIRFLGSRDRPESTPTSSSAPARKIGLLNLFPRGSMSKTSEERHGTPATRTDSASRSATVRSPVKIRVLDASPYRPVTRQNVPYRSRWDNSEINVTSRAALEEESKTVSLSEVVKPKVINPAPLKENLIRPARPIPFPGKYPRSINGHAALRPVYDSDKPRLRVFHENLELEESEVSSFNRSKSNSGKRKISPSDLPPFKKTLTLNETPHSSHLNSDLAVSSCARSNFKSLVGASATEKRTLRRRSKSCSPNRSLFRGSDRGDLRSSVLVSPHRLARSPEAEVGCMNIQQPRIRALRSPTSTIDFPPSSPLREGMGSADNCHRSSLVASNTKPANFEESWRREKLWGKRMVLGDMIRSAK
ncbi:Dbl (DH) domain [Trinorchestia longiramus]|nr:Dbl (DH) domain [Trinorchestia longiramus]